MSYGTKAFYKRAIVYTIIVGSVVCNLPAWAQKAPKPQPPVRMDKEGHLVYTPDEKGNRIPDFSYAGYAAGEQSIPEVPIKIFVPIKPGDATARIQAALDYVSALPPDKNGFRGAVLLSRGRHELAGTLRIAATGVVLRGSGMGADGTLLAGTGVEREAMIAMRGKDDKTLKESVAITDAYVPVNAQRITVAAGHAFHNGDAVYTIAPLPTPG